MNKKVVWLPYDFDTALGINNEGELVFSYNLEDTDHLEGGANVFNGQDSVVWCNLRDAFGDDIKTMYQTLRLQGDLSYDAVEQMFETHQDKWSEAIFNEDSYFKYLAPLVSPDAGKEPTGAYLGMLQGSKKEQRKWWMYNRFRYMDSKYNTGDAETDVITVRGYAKSNITITPYADVYASVKFGSYVVQSRAERNESVTLVCPIDELNDTEIYIYSASQLASIGDLSGLKVGFADFSMGTKLRNLKVGDSSASYTNNNLKTLYLGSNSLLQTLDVRNCAALGTDTQETVDIHGCTNIEHIYFDGTSVKGVILPNGGIIKTLHLPATTTNLTIMNHTSIEDLTVASYSNISTLRLENLPTVDMKEILTSIPAGARVRLIGFAWEAEDGEEIEDLLDILDTMTGLDEGGYDVNKAQVQGSIHTDSLTGAQIADFNARYPYLTVTADHIVCKLRYYNFDGSTLLNEETLIAGADGTWPTQPTRPSTPGYTYTFIGWNTQPNQSVADPNAMKNVTIDRNIYAAYTAVVRRYTVRFYNGSSLLYTANNVAYGTEAVYAGPLPTSSDPNFIFNGWAPSNLNIQGDTDCIAQFKDTRARAKLLIERTITDASLSDITYIGPHTFANCQSLSSAAFPEVLSVGSWAFAPWTKISTIDMPKVTHIGSWAFSSCNSIRSINLPNLVSAEEAAFAYCASLSYANLPALSVIAPALFSNCAFLTSIYCSSATAILGQFNFRACSRLETINLPSLEIISAVGAFSNCSALRTVSFPNLSMIIGGNNFCSCTSLSTLSFPSLEIISGYGVFSGLSTLTTVNLPALKTINGGSAFALCKSLQSLTLPSLESINASSAFYGCSTLSTISLPALSILLGDGIFAGCSVLTSISLPSLETMGGSNMFSNCSALSHISFPKLSFINSNDVFSGCNPLMTMSFPLLKSISGANTFRPFGSVWSSIDFPSLETISGNYTFYSLSMVPTVSLPALKTISGMNNFKGCSGLLSLTLPSLESIYNAGTFADCSALSTVSLPVISQISGDYTFSNCQNLMSIYLLSSSVVRLGNYVFSSTPMVNSAYTGSFGSIYVPASLVNAYKTAYNWSSISSRITAYIE